MGRSVSAPYNASSIRYVDVSEFDDEFDFEFFIEDLQSQVKALWPSMDCCDKWIGREDHAIMENNLAYIGVSEYCGLASVWIVSKAEDYLNTGYYEDIALSNLSDGWVSQVVPNFDKTFGDLERVGVFSNGEAFYRKI